MTWMLYGATGYTGVLTAEEAVRRGHQPLLAGRNEEKLRSLADRLGLSYIAVSLDDEAGLRAALKDVEIVLHNAGPFVHTARPMMEACIDTGTHYLDITGEIAVFEQGFRRNERAKAAGIALISGVGFDVVPTDCMARYVSEKLPGATSLELAFHGIGGVSAGTAKSAVTGLGSGGPGSALRRGGKLIPARIGDHVKTVTFSNSKSRTVIGIPWGDLSTAYRTTGIPNITTYMAMHPQTIKWVKTWRGIGLPLLRVPALQVLALNVVEARFKGPSEERRESAGSYVYARAWKEDGESGEAWLETLEGYKLTALTGVRAVEKLLDPPVELSGTLTPAGAFGPDFIMEISGTRRFDSLDEFSGDS